MAGEQIILIETDDQVAEQTARQLQECGYGVPAVSRTLTQGLKEVRRLRPDLVLMEIRGNENERLVETVSLLRTRHSTPVVYLSSLADAETVHHAKCAGVYGYLLKPCESAALRAAIETALYKARLDRDVLDQINIFMSLLNSLGDGVIAVQTDGQVSYMNPAAECITGRVMLKSLGRPLDKIFPLEPADFPDGVKGLINQVVKRGKTVRLPHTLHLLRDDGEPRVVELALRPIWREGRRLEGVALIFRDITPRMAEYRPTPLDAETTPLRQK